MKRVQISHNIVQLVIVQCRAQYCTAGYCAVPCAQVTKKRLKKVKLDNKSLIRCFGVKYGRIFLLVVCILTRPAGSSHRNI